MKRILHDYLTGLDGKTYAIGRGLGLTLFCAGIFMPTLLATVILFKDHPPLRAWTDFIMSLSVYLPALTGAVTILIWGTNSTEPKDK